MMKTVQQWGNPRSPELMFGIPFGFQYKNFDFSVLLQGATKIIYSVEWGLLYLTSRNFEQDKIGRVKKNASGPLDTGNGCYCQISGIALWNT